ncbi:alpha/beta hydrolase [Deltaproteobacteria bacterium TL4]
MSKYQRVVYFTHGKESGPWGTKIQYLADIAQKKGFAVESPDYSGMRDPRERVEKLLSLKPEASEYLVLMGSSMGAWVTLMASKRLNPQGLFLLAPAVYIGEGYSHQAPEPYGKVIDIIHGWHDAVVPVENVIRYAREHQVRLHLLDSEHRLTDQMSVLGKLFALFLDDVMQPPEADIRSEWELEQESKFQKETFEKEKPRIPR